MWTGESHGLTSESHRDRAGETGKKRTRWEGKGCELDVFLGHGFLLRWGDGLGRSYSQSSFKCVGLEGFWDIKILINKSTRGDGGARSPGNHELHHKLQTARSSIEETASMNYFSTNTAW